MRILHVITLGELGGAQRYVAELAGRQRDCGYVVEVAAGTTEWLATRTGAFTAVHAVPHLKRAVSPRADVAAFRALFRLIASGGFDVVHTHSAKAGVLGRFAGRFARVPVVAHTSHGTVLAEKLSLAKRGVYWCAERAATSVTNRLFAVSQTERTVLARAMGIAEHAIEVMTIVPAHVREITRRWSAERSDPSDLVAVGNLYRTKGYDVLLRAVELLAADHPHLRVTIYGSGPELGALQSQAARSGLGRRVDFGGQVSDVPDRLAAAGVVVMPSRKEGLPIALLEAMATGAPVVATAVGAVREALGHEVPLARADDPADLARHLSVMITSRDARETRARAGRVSYERLAAQDDPRAACTMYT